MRHYFLFFGLDSLCPSASSGSSSSVGGIGIRNEPNIELVPNGQVLSQGK